MRREETNIPAPFIPFKIVIETKKERDILDALDQLMSGMRVKRAADLLSLTFEEVNNTLTKFGKLLRNE